MSFRKRISTRLHTGIQVTPFIVDVISECSVLVAAENGAASVISFTIELSRILILGRFHPRLGHCMLLQVLPKLAW